MSAEERDAYPLCGARARGGGRCRLFAGSGTNHRGIGRCKFHGGSTPSHVTSAVIAEATNRAIEFGEPIAVDPADALLTVLQISAGMVAWVKQELASVEDRNTFEGQVLLRMWADERDRVARIATAALSAGVQERMVRLAEQYGTMLAQLVQAILYDPELELTRAQRQRAPEVARRHLVALERGSAE